jgi:hypothetical protein
MAKYVWQAVDYLEVIGDGSTPPPPTLPPPSTGSKIEIENNYTKISDVGSNGSIVTKSFSINSNGKGVSIPDDGDKIGVNFNVSETGTYTLRVWLRSGNATYPTSYFNSGYTYKFDLTGIGPVNFSGIPSSVQGPFSAWGGSHWGFMEATVNFSTTGAKTLGIQAEYVWQAVDYLEVIKSGSSSRTASLSSLNPEMVDDISESRFIAYPNPFVDNVNIEFETSTRNALVKLSVVNLNGKVVKTIQKQFDSTGRQQLSWDGGIGDGQRAHHGLYILKLDVNDKSYYKRVVLK